MQVAEVRRCLFSVRQAWATQSPEAPLNLSTIVPNGMELHSFCYSFILAHHNKRMQRAKIEFQMPNEVEDGCELDAEEEPAPVAANV